MERRGRRQVLPRRGNPRRVVSKMRAPQRVRIQSKLPSYGEAKKDLPYSGILEIAAQCSRGAEDSFSGCKSPLYVLFLKEYNKVRRIGQSPSAADLAFGSLDPALSKQLRESDRKELGTAIGLRAHGVGIGSFVYLRRIFEIVAGVSPFRSGRAKQGGMRQSIRVQECLNGSSFYASTYLDVWSPPQSFTACSAPASTNSLSRHVLRTLRWFRTQSS